MRHSRRNSSVLSTRMVHVCSTDHGVCMLSLGDRGSQCCSSGGLRGRGEWRAEAEISLGNKGLRTDFAASMKEGSN